MTHHAVFFRGGRLPLAALLAFAPIACDDAAPADDDPVDPTDASGPADDPSAHDDGEEPEAAPTCDATDLRALTLPVDPYDPDGETFTYYVQVLDRGADDRPTVVHIPGGPGLPSIGRGPDLPDDVNLVLTDPRGVGCNAADAPHPASFYGTERFAGDVIAAITDLGLDDYILYGHSYGTVLSTVVASRIEEEGLPPPKLVVLEGVLGEAMDSDDAAYRALWPLVRDALPESVREQLSREPLPLGLSALQWGEMISTTLSQFSPAVLHGLLLGLDDGADPTQLAETVEAFTGGTPLWDDEITMGLFRPVACREIAEDSWFGFELVDGEIVPSINVCDDVDLAEPYAAADWPITAPIVYVQGTVDPATVHSSARLHFEAQTRSDRTFVAIPDVGHAPLSWALPTACGDTVWNVLLDGGDLDAALASCNVGAMIEHRAAE